MNDLLKKELKLVNIPIEEFLKSTLLDGFKNRKGQLVIRVDGFAFIETTVDEDNSEIKEKIIVTGVSAYVDVQVAIGDDGSYTNNTLDIFINKGFVLNYDFESKSYIIEDIDGVIIIDRTFN